jgi:hypothetical protein
MQPNRIWNSLGREREPDASPTAKVLSPVFVLCPMGFTPAPWVVQVYRDAYEQAQRAARPAQTVTFSLN